MDSVKKILHIRSKSKAQASDHSTDSSTTHEQDILRHSIDDELASMTPDERKAYLSEFEEAERNGKPKKGSLLEKLIERGNRKTEEQLAREAREREAAQASRV